MRRRHHAIAASLLVIGLIYLFLQQHGSLTEATGYIEPLETLLPGSRGTSAPGHNSDHDEKGSSDPVIAPGWSDTPNTNSQPEPPLSEENTIAPSIEQHEPKDTPNSPSSEPHSSPPEVAPSPPLTAEFPFQQDLALNLPTTMLDGLKTLNPHNYHAKDAHPPYAYATFMASRNPSLQDPYYLAIHSLIYRLLWSPRSKSTTYPLLVFVADFVTPEQRALLSGAGALVRDLAPLPWTPNVPDPQARWADLFAKLHMWNETEFSRLVFLDADAFPLANIDAMFDLAPLQHCREDRLQLDDFLADRTPVCEDYVFAGVPQDPARSATRNLNVGSMVLSPSEGMHARLLQNYGKTDKYDARMAEQAFLDWQFSADGAFPGSPLEREWGGFFPGEDEKGKLKIVHEKIWSGEGWTKVEWDETWTEMMGFYSSKEFLEERERDGGGVGT